MAKPSKSPGNMRALSRPPKTYPATYASPRGDKAFSYEQILHTPELKASDSANTSVKSIFFRRTAVPGQAHPRNSPTTASPTCPRAGKAPGYRPRSTAGGGTAFESWVRLWNARGYAAIAMDTCGCVPKGTYGNLGTAANPRPGRLGRVRQDIRPCARPMALSCVAMSILRGFLASIHARGRPEAHRDPAYPGAATSPASPAGVDKTPSVVARARLRLRVPRRRLGLAGYVSKPCRATRSPNGSGCGIRRLYLPQSKVPTLWVDGTKRLCLPHGLRAESYPAAHRPQDALHPSCAWPTATEDSAKSPRDRGHSPTRSARAAPR